MWISRIINVHNVRAAGVGFVSSLILTTILRTKNFNLFYISSVFYLRLCDAELPKDDLQKVESCRSFSELYVKMYNEYLFICWY